MLNPIDYDSAQGMLQVEPVFTNKPYYLGNNRRLRNKINQIEKENQYQPIEYGQVQSVPNELQAGKFIRPDNSPISYQDLNQQNIYSSGLTTELSDDALQISEGYKNRAIGKVPIIPTVGTIDYGSTPQTKHAYSGTISTETIAKNGNGGRFYLGDSIAHGYKSSDKGNGITKVGATPAQILDNIKKNPNQFKGQTVYLSSGLSNNPNDIASVEAQLQALSSEGANVKLIGVSNSFKGSTKMGTQMNGQLQGLAQKYNVEFLGGFTPADKAKVHPKYDLRNIGLGK